MATKPPPSPADAAQAEATRAAGLAIGEWLQGSILAHNAARQIATLRIEDLDAIAIAAISGWICKRAEQGKASVSDEAEGVLLA